MTFYKMHGIGNDYVYINCTRGKEPSNPSELAKKLSNRNFGVGSDGLILICNSKVANFKMRIFNKDGSEAQMCGNGIRCVAKLVYDLGLIHREKITIETLAGIKTVKLNFAYGKIKSIEANMGEPILQPTKMQLDCTKIKADNKMVQLPIWLGNQLYSFTCVSMGNPHAITFIKNVNEFPVQKYGPIVEKQDVFLENTNVEFVEIINKNRIKVRVWERGAGETLACGTGACAAVVAGNLNGYTDKNVDVELKGGNLKIKWENDNHIYMTGSAVTVYKGEWIDG